MDARNYDLCRMRRRENEAQPARQPTAEPAPNRAGFDGVWRYSPTLQVGGKIIAESDRDFSRPHDGVS